MNGFGFITVLHFIATQICLDWCRKRTVQAIQVETREFKAVIRCLNARVGINPLPISAIYVECGRDVWDNVGRQISCYKKTAVFLQAKEKHHPSDNTILKIFLWSLKIKKTGSSKDWITL